MCLSPVSSHHCILGWMVWYLWTGYGMRKCGERRIRPWCRSLASPALTMGSRALWVWLPAARAGLPHKSGPSGIFSWQRLCSCTSTTRLPVSGGSCRASDSCCTHSPGHLSARRTLRRLGPQWPSAPLLLDAWSWSHRFAHPRKLRKCGVI